MLVTLGRGLSQPTIAQTTPPTPPASLGLVIPSTVFDVDATRADSYAGSGQVWANLEDTPADGQAQTAYDFYRGADASATTDDPAFVGSAGDPSAYFLLDGGDIFTLLSASNTSFLNALHKTTGGTDFWLAMAFYMADQSVTSVAFSTKTISSTIGFNMQFTGSEQIKFQQTGSSATVTTSSTDHAAVSVGTHTVVIASYSGGTLRSWVNSTTKVQRAMTFNTCTANASGYLTIGGQASAGTSKLANGTRLYAVAMGNAYIDDAEAAAIISAYTARHGRTYV